MKRLVLGLVALLVAAGSNVFTSSRETPELLCEARSDLCRAPDRKAELPDSPNGRPKPASIVEPMVTAQGPRTQSIAAHLFESGNLFPEATVIQPV